jgi:hypothetical protein
MKSARFGALAVLVALWSAPADAQSVTVQFSNGMVTIRAQNAPVRAILAEWARVGGARIVNAERVVGAPVTLELTDVPERQALDVVLRGVAGYIAGSREIASAGTSSLDRILILPTSAVNPAAAAASAPRGQAPFAPPPAPMVFVPGDPEENPPDDVPQGAEPPVAPAQLQQRLREAAARAAAERAAAAEDAENEEPKPAAAPTTRSGNPFGNVRGSSRPGEITPVPETQKKPNPLRPNGDPEP